MAEVRHCNRNVSRPWIRPTRRLPAQHPHRRGGKPKSSPGHIWKSAEAATAVPCGARVSQPVNPVSRSPGREATGASGRGCGGERGRALHRKCAGKGRGPGAKPGTGRAGRQGAASLGAGPLSKRLSQVQHGQNPNHKQLARLVSGLKPVLGLKPQMGSSAQRASALQQSIRVLTRRNSLRSGSSVCFLCYFYCCLSGA